ncbi:MAG: hypothetical protein ACOYVF_08250 [Candidatus Zixiibacteriota bacterium]
MKKILILLIAVLFAFGSAQAGKRIVYETDSGDHDVEVSDYVNIDIDDGSIFLEEEGGDYNTVEINEEYELFVNDRQVKLDSEQQKLVEEFYVLAMDIVREGKSLGWEGAKIGVSGAKLGMKAVGRIFKMLFTNYDEDDFERDMERDAEILEAKAEKLEDRAENIEDMADDLKYVTEEMFDIIPELRELEWF